MRFCLSLILLVAVGVLVAGCGSDGGSEDAAAPQSASGSDATSPNPSSGDGDTGSPTRGGSIESSPLTKAQYIKRASAICDRHRKERFQATRAYVKQRAAGSEREITEEEMIVAVRTDVFIPSMEDQLTDLRELGAPQGDKKPVSAYLAAFEDWLAALEQHKDPTSVSALDQQLDRAGRLARAYGVIECSYG